MEAREIVTRKPHLKVDIPFTPEEAVRFRTYLAANDKKAGRFVRTTVLRAIEEEEKAARIAGGEEPVRLELGGGA